ncbi:MAG: N-acyl-D-amino-acid deacylase family protein [Micromonosporaceae bacterium]
MGHRILITGGRIADGLGGEPRPGEVLVDGERILAVAPPGRIAAPDASPLDTTGQVVAPGFIDVHSHGDNAPLLAGDDVGKILQGVTTEVVGNCGFSLAPVREAYRPVLEEYLARLFGPVEATWSSFGEFLHRCDAAGYVTNYCPLVGHGTLRIAAFGVADRPAAASEFRLMCQLLDEALDSGAFGMSSGLIYPPGRYADTDELVALATRLGPHRTYATHLRTEGIGLAGAIDEALSIGERAGCRVQISHLKAMGRAAWGGVVPALDTLDAARAAGHAVRHDAYPYTASSTLLTTLLPPELLTGAGAEILDRLRHPGTGALLADAIAHGRPGWENRIGGTGWQSIRVASSASGRFDGQSLDDVASVLRLPPVEALRQLLVDERLRVTVVTFGMSERDVAAVLAHPDTIIGSDGAPPDTSGVPHPRGYGTFPRVLGHYVRERGLIPLGAAVRRMTSLPADWFGIPDRGRIRPGQVADLVAFDPDAVIDTADYPHPTGTPKGIGWVMQSGHIVVRDGAYRGPRRGKRLVPLHRGSVR